MSGWRRVADAIEPDEAFAVVDAGAEWVFFWCGGGTTRSSGPEPEARRALACARAEAVGPVERKRLAAKAARKGRSTTVVLAESWVYDAGKRLIVFYEGGPYILPDRAMPDRL